MGLKHEFEIDVLNVRAIAVLLHLEFCSLLVNFHVSLHRILRIFLRSSNDISNNEMTE